MQGQDLIVVPERTGQGYTIPPQSPSFMDKEFKIKMSTALGFLFVGALVMHAKSKDK